MKDQVNEMFELDHVQDGKEVIRPRIDKGNQEQNLLWHSKMSQITGALTSSTISLLMNQVANTFPSIDNDPSGKINAYIPLFGAIGTNDELEGMLAVQMVVIHNMSMEMMKRAMLEGQTPEGICANVNRSTKFTRTFIAQMEILNKHRVKGQQKMTIEHVQVNEGGKAVIGNVEQGGRGTGDKMNNNPIKSGEDG